MNYTSVLQIYVYTTESQFDVRVYEYNYDFIF